MQCSGAGQRMTGGHSYLCVENLEEKQEDWNAKRMSWIHCLLLVFCYFLLQINSLTSEENLNLWKWQIIYTIQVGHFLPQTSFITLRCSSLEIKNSNMLSPGSSHLPALCCPLIPLPNLLWVPSIQQGGQGLCPLKAFKSSGCSPQISEGYQLLPWTKVSGF